MIKYNYWINKWKIEFEDCADVRKVVELETIDIFVSLLSVYYNAI